VFVGEPVLSRRAWLAGLVSSAGVIVAACSSPGAVVLDTPEGRVLQYEGDDALILVSGAEQSYRLGEPMRLNLMVNNQSTSPISVRLRTKLLGRGDQPVVQAEPALLDVRADDASSVDQVLPLGLDLLPGDYTLSIEVPPWKRDGRDFGRGATLRAPLRVDPAADRP
jgi:hypothetical protein